MMDKMNVVIMVSDGYPDMFSANNTKGEYIALGLKEAGCEVVMSDSVLGSKGTTNLKMGKSDKGIDYVKLPYGKIAKNVVLIWKLLRKHKKNGCNHLLLGMNFFPFFVIISLMAAMLGYTRSTLYHEDHIGMNHPKKWQRIEAYVKDNFFAYFLNAIFPISHYLKDKSEKFKKSMMLVPVLASYNRCVDCRVPKEYFTFCGHAGYLLRNTIVLDAFKKFVETGDYKNYKLILVLVGNEKILTDAQHLIDSYNLQNRIEVKLNLPQSELYNLYENSLGLIIPLDPNNLQDKARFSQKIAEYVACKRPVITNAAGEVPYYFENNKSAVIVPYDSDGFCNGMLYLANHIEQSNRIGECGYQVGCSFFDYNAVGRKMAFFINRL